jgi:hypothetical protein
MATHYQVIADFSFSGCRPVLVNLSLHSTRAACSSFPFQPEFSKITTVSHIFPTLQNARSYIAYLFRVYPNCPAPFPVLDKGQPDLFQEVSQCI